MFCISISDTLSVLGWDEYRFMLVFLFILTNRGKNAEQQQITIKTNGDYGGIIFMESYYEGIKPFQMGHIMAVCMCVCAFFHIFALIGWFASAQHP